MRLSSRIATAPAEVRIRVWVRLNNSLSGIICIDLFCFGPAEEGLEEPNRGLSWFVKISRYAFLSEGGGVILSKGSQLGLGASRRQRHRVVPIAESLIKGVVS